MSSPLNNNTLNPNIYISINNGRFYLSKLSRAHHHRKGGKLILYTSQVTVLTPVYVTPMVRIKSDTLSSFLPAVILGKSVPIQRRFLLHSEYEGENFIRVFYYIFSEYSIKHLSVCNFLYNQVPLGSTLNSM